MRRFLISLLFVSANAAAACPAPPQYDGLEGLYRKYRARGLVMLGFPSNDFGAQEPGSNREISTFCVKATGAAPAWNFHKYLVDRGGRRVQSFPSRVEPDDPKLIATLEQLLAQPPEDRP